MSKFNTALEAGLISDKIWKLAGPLVYESDLLDTVIVVPTGFETDFASVPRVPVIYMLWGNRAHREAVVHDYLFRVDSFPVVSFGTANRVFLEAMLATGKSRGIAYPMYWGVCLGSRGYYHKKRVLDSGSGSGTP